MTGTGTVVVSVPANGAQDSAANGNTASTSTDNIVTFNPSTPVVTGIARVNSSPTSASSVQFAITFSESVNGVGSGDFTLAATGVTGAAIASVIGSGSAYTVTVNTGTGSGTLGLNLVDDDSIVDTSSTPLGGSGSGNGNFTGQVYILDRTAPTTTITISPSDPSNSAGPSFSFIGSDNLTAAANLTFACSLDGGAFVACTSPQAYSGLADGSHTFTVKASDAADNTDATLDSYTWAIDTKIQMYQVFIPQVMGTPLLPDLVVKQIVVVQGVVQVTIRNQGAGMKKYLARRRSPLVGALAKEKPALEWTSVD